VDRIQEETVMAPRDDTEFARATAWLEAGAGSNEAREQGDAVHQAAIWAALRQVIDPELGLDIVTLGLVYDIDIAGGLVEVTHTLTTPGCPMEEVIASGIRMAVGGVPGVTGVTNRVVWEPRWHPAMIQEVEW
jgi:metal-sulfur cluster biosynthetic enzyme